jgi:two-component system response regulator HydG
MHSILVVDDVTSIHEMLGAVLQAVGFVASFATDGEMALASYKERHFDIVLADIDMKPMDGITLLGQLKLYDPNVVCIIMTAYASTDSAIKALKFGAFDYLQKPFRVEELIATIRRALEMRSLQAAKASVGGPPSPRVAEIEGRLIGGSQVMTKLILHVRKLMNGRSPVLLNGESGTGKSTVAEILHAASGAPDDTFARIDCSLSSEGSLRMGLLGRNGENGEWIKQAMGGTLFLQHVQCLPEPVQGELVRVLRRCVAGFRLVCSTNEDLEKLVDVGKFNEELFYRIASLPLRLPPLREHIEDIPLLVAHYAAQAVNPLFDAYLVTFTDDAMEVMKRYSWPGNVTELAQVVSNLATATETRVIVSEQLPLRLQELSRWPELAVYLAAQNRKYVDHVLGACHGDKAAAAMVLNIDARILA